jgi:hypothetical protein
MAMATVLQGHLGVSDAEVESALRQIMIDESDHAAFVNAWLEHLTKTLPQELRLEIFEASLSALWNCTRMTLGDVTLMAIMDRVLYNAAEKFPFFSALKVEPNRGFQGQDLRERLASISDPELMDGIRYVLVEFLTVIGNLTADILTPELHSELSKVVLGRGDLHRKGAPTQPPPREHEHTEGKDKKS